MNDERNLHEAVGVSSDWVCGRTSTFSSTL